jgi:hypothetical protein
MCIDIPPGAWHFNNFNGSLLEHLETSVTQVEFLAEAVHEQLHAHCTMF